MNRILVIGLDGVPLHLLEGWAATGHLPVLKKLMEEGAVGLLNSTIPDTSGPAWSAFMTGKNPGKTNVFDFLYRKNGTYAFYPNNARNRDGQSIFRLVSDAGKKIVSINVPLSYPVEAVNGFMIGGWMTPYTAKDFVHPPELLAEIEQAVGEYHVYPQATYSEANPSGFFQASHDLLDMRTRVARYLMDKDDWDLFMIVYFDTDRILHQVWHYLDPNHPLRHKDPDVDKSGPVRDYFNRLDSKIGELVAASGPDTDVIIMSDHGMGPTRNMIVVNTWMLEQGMIKLKKDPLTWVKLGLFKLGFTLRNVHKLVDRLGLAKHAEYKVLYSADWLLKKIFLSFDNVDWSQSIAYSFGRSMGPIFLNVKGREPEGIIEPGEEYQRVRAEIAEKLKKMRDPRTGEELVGKIYFPEDIYSGPHVKRAPDLILEPANLADRFYGLSDFGASHFCLPMYRYSGMHRQFGSLIMNGDQVQKGVRVDDAELIDIAPTVLHMLGLAVPTDMDGRPLLSALNGTLSSPDSVKWQEVDPDDDSSRDLDSGYTEVEARQVEDRLRSLGYMG